MYCDGDVVEVNIHRLITITDRALDVVFSRFRDFSFTLTLRQKSKVVTRSLRKAGSLCFANLREVCVKQALSVL